MPNLKLYVDEGLFAARGGALRAALVPLRDMLCRALRVGPPACQLAVLPVMGLADQPGVNVELAILPHADRTPALIAGLAQDLRSLVAEATGQRVAVRIAFIDPLTFVALK